MYLLIKVYGFKDLLIKNGIWKGKNVNLTVRIPGKYGGTRVMVRYHHQ